MKNLKVLISGGGTGGHIFPAVSIANEIKSQMPHAEILFVGAESRMEMEKVPAAGYRIIGLPVYGFDRRNIFRNFKVLWNLVKSIFMARNIVRDFKPDIAVGVGGYASGPTLWVASHMGVPTLLQEQNGYAGVTNKLLAAKADAICVAYENMDWYNYSLISHTVKSNAKTIGAVYLSEVSYKHEEAGKNEDIDFIYGEFENYKKMISEINVIAMDMFKK